MSSTTLLTYVVPSYVSIVEFAFNTVLLLPGFSWLIIRGVPSLIIVQTQVSAPLNSRPVNGYRKGGPLPNGVQLICSLVVQTCCM